MKSVAKNQIPARIVKRLLSPLQRFAAIEASSGLLLLGVTAIALIWANSPWKETYHHLIELPISLTVGEWSLRHSLHHWVNDGLMVIFFFLVGMEIKREMVQGELSTLKKSALPMVAALGGMIVPATIYAFLNHNSPTHHGWGIPMATDIAFAVGVLALFSKRVPFALKVFLLALAIVDDLGAVLVIAIFYTADLSSHALAAAAGLTGLVVFLQIARVKAFWVYWVIGAGVWLCVLKSGVHATVAGVVLGLLTPLNVIDKEDKQSPLEILVESLHGWVSFGIMPVFAFVNAGVSLTDVSIANLVTAPLSLGIILGLWLGKPIGIFALSWIACRLGIAELPRGVKWKHILAAGAIAGIGFTMALFIASLAGFDPHLTTYSKIGILLGSALSAIMGAILLLRLPEVKQKA